MYHPLLQPNLSAPITIVSAALWCAAALGVVVIGPSKNDAPAPAAHDPFPPPAEIILAYQMEFAPMPSFGDRFGSAAPQSVPPLLVTADGERLPGKPQRTEPQMEPEKLTSRADRRHRAREPTLACGDRGRRYYRIGKHLSWKCRR